MVILAGDNVMAEIGVDDDGQAQARQEGVNRNRGEPEEFVIEEIIVTAQKRSQSLVDVPITVTVASGEYLVDRGISSTSDLAKIVPGMTAPPSPYNVPVYSIRGVGFYDSTVSASPTVAVYNDEVPLPFSAMTNAASLDIARVEVLKGPQGTLFGNNTTGGAINYVANKPTEALEAGVDASYGRFNKFDMQGFISGPLTDRVKARFAARSTTSDDWQKNYSAPGTLGSERRWQARLLLDWDLNERVKASFNFSGWRDRSDTQAVQLAKIILTNPTDPAAPIIAALPTAPADPRAANWAPESFFGPYRHDDDFYLGSVRIDYELNDTTTITSITAYEDYSADAVYDFDGSVREMADVHPRADIETFFQELRLIGSTARTDYTFGLNYESDETLDVLDYRFGENTASQIGPIHIGHTGNYTDQDITTWAIFGHIERAITDNVSLTAALRYTESNRDFEGCGLDLEPGNTHEAFNFLQTIFRTDGGYDPIGQQECWTFNPQFISYGKDRVRGELDEDNVSYRLGLNYETTNDGLLYFSMSKGYKAGSFPTGAMSRDIQYTPVEQESALAYELGIKQPLASGRVQFNAAGFYYDYDDKQLRGRIPDLIFGPLDALVQIPKSRVWGVEAQFVARPVRDYRLDVAVTYVDTEIKEYVGFHSTSGDINYDFSGSRFPYAPKWQVVADNQYDFSISSSLTAFIGASLTYNSDTNSNLGNQKNFYIPSYTLIDVRVGIKDANEKWRIQAWGRNVTDEYYWTNVVHFNESLVRYAGRPATYGVSFNYSFY
jgi:outer membrane receptor protein involved in Fe transport